jgi:hypothetical protein
METVSLHSARRPGRLCFSFSPFFIWDKTGEGHFGFGHSGIYM